VTDLVLSGRQYRAVDAATKLAGVALVAGGLELGIGSTAGGALAFAGVALGVCTVFFTERHA
jgi:hypothetical protein